MATTLQGKTNTEDIFAEHMSGHYRWTPTVLLPPRHLLEQRATEQTRAQTEAGHTSKRGY